jgi:predicted RNA-binding protein with PIN domain
MMHYYIDGYNLLFCLLDQEECFLEESRNKLIETLQYYLSSFSFPITLVFDSKNEDGFSITQKKLSPIQIIFTEKGISADNYILERVEISPNASQITVITEDKPLAKACRSIGAQTKSIDSFLKWITKRKKQPEKTSYEDTNYNIKRLEKIFEDRLKKTIKTEE